MSGVCPPIASMLFLPILYMLLTYLFFYNNNKLVLCVVM